MTLFSWLESLAALTPDPLATPAGPASRRGALARLGRGAVAASGLGATLLASPNAAAAPQSVVTDALNTVLRVAQAQQALLTTALAASATLFPAPADRTTFEQLALAMNDLVGQLRTAITQSGDAAEVPLRYDFSGAGLTGAPAQTGPLQPLTSYADLLTLTQALADLLTRTLVGQLGVVAGTLFTDLLGQLLPTAARLAALVRRRTTAGASVWVRGGENDVPNLFSLFYADDDNTTIFGIPVAITPGLSGRPAALYTESFDEPMTAATARAVVGQLAF